MTGYNPSWRGTALPLQSEVFARCSKSSLRDLGWKIQGSFAAVSARPGTVLEVRLGVYTENHNARVVASMKLRDELILSLVEPGLPSSKP